MDIAAQKQSSVLVMLAEVGVAVEMPCFEHSAWSVARKGAAGSKLIDERLTKFLLPAPHTNHRRPVSIDKFDGTRSPIEEQICRSRPHPVRRALRPSLS